MHTSSEAGCAGACSARNTRAHVAAWFVAAVVVGGAVRAKADAPAAELSSGVAIEAETAPRFGVAALEATGVLALGGVWYWSNRDFNKPDWEYEDPVDRLSLDAIRLDDNNMATNVVSHPAAGAAYYSAGRLNGLSPVESFALAFTSSAIWEVGFEFREKISFNDLIMTPVGGVPLGEFMFNLGEYVTSAADGGPTDNLGLSARYGHRFETAYESVTDAGGGPETVHALALDAEIVRLVGAAAPISQSRWFADAACSEFELRLGSTAEQWSDTTINARTVLAGRHMQDLVRRDGVLEGTSFTTGLAVAYTHQQRMVGPNEDRLGAVHVAGSWSSLDWRNGPARVRVTADAYVDFAAVDPLARDAWSASEASGNVALPTVVENKDYYFAAGYHGRVRFVVGYDRLELGADAQQSGYASIDSLDRHEEELATRIPVTDAWSSYRGWIGLRSSANGPVAAVARAGVEGETRDGTFGEVTALVETSRYFVQFGVQM